MTNTIISWLVSLMLVLVCVTAIVSIINIHRESREHQKRLDEWYEKEMKWLEDMMKDEDDDRSCHS